MDALLLEACQEVGLTRAPWLHNPNQDRKHRPAWFDDSCRVAQRAVWAATREHGRYTTAALAAHRAFCLVCHKAAHLARAQLPRLLKERPADFWRLLSPPRAPVGVTAQDLASYFETLLHHRDVEAVAAPAVVPLDPPLMGQELQTILDTRYRGAASAGLCPVPSHCLHHLPLPALEVLAPWLQLLPQRGLPPLW